VYENIFEGNIYVRSRFSYVDSSHDLRARTYAHRLKGTLIVTAAELVVVEVIIL